MVIIAFVYESCHKADCVQCFVHTANGCLHQAACKLNYRRMSLNATPHWNGEEGQKNIATTSKQVVLAWDRKMRNSTKAPKIVSFERRNAHRDSFEHRNDCDRSRPAGQGHHNLCAKIKSGKTAMAAKGHYCQDDPFCQSNCWVVKTQKPDNYFQSYFDSFLDVKFMSSIVAPTALWTNNRSRTETSQKTLES